MIRIENHFERIFFANLGSILPLRNWWAKATELESKTTEPNWCAVPSAFKGDYKSIRIIDFIVHKLYHILISMNSIPTGTPLSNVKTPRVNWPAVAAIIRFAAIIGPPTRPAFRAIIHDANIPNASTWAKNLIWISNETFCKRFISVEHIKFESVPVVELNSGSIFKKILDWVHIWMEIIGWEPSISHHWISIVNKTGVISCYECSWHSHKECEGSHSHWLFLQNIYEFVIW